jgi:hypothetical protein
MMRFRRARHVLVALGLSALACADDRLSTPTQAAVPAPSLPDARLLARSDALISFCAKADPAAAAKYQQQGKRIVQGKNAAAVTRVRNGDEYRKAHGSITEFLDKVDERNAKRACSAYLPKE